MSATFAKAIGYRNCSLESRHEMASRYLKSVRDVGHHGTLYYFCGLIAGLTGVVVFSNGVVYSSSIIARSEVPIV